MASNPYLEAAGLSGGSAPAAPAASGEANPYLAAAGIGSGGAAPATAKAKPTVRAKGKSISTNPVYQAAVNEALSKGVATSKTLDAIGRSAVQARQQRAAKGKAIRGSIVGQAARSGAPMSVASLSPIQAAVGGSAPFHQGGDPFGFMSGPLGVLSTGLNAPESFAVHLGEAGAAALRGHGGQALHALHQAVTSPNDTASSVLAAHGLKLPEPLAILADLGGNPLNVLGFGGAATGVASDAARAAEAAHGAELGATGGEDAMTMLAQHHFPAPGEAAGPAPKVPGVTGTEEYLRPFRERAAKYRGRVSDLEAEKQAALSRRATVRQGARAGARSQRAQQVLGEEISQIPGTRAQRNLFADVFGQPSAEGEGARLAGRTTRRSQLLKNMRSGPDIVTAPRAAGAPRTVRAADLPYPVAAPATGAVARAHEAADAVKELLRLPRAPTSAEAANAGRLLERSQAEIDAAPGLRGKVTPRTPGTPAAAGGPGGPLTATVREEPGVGLTGRQARAAQRMVTQARKLYEMRMAEGAQPSRQTLVNAGRSLERLQAQARAASGEERAATQEALRAGRARTRASMVAKAPKTYVTTPLRAAGRAAREASQAIDDLAARQPLATGRSMNIGARLAKAQKAAQKAERSLDTAMKRAARMEDGGLSVGRVLMDRAAVVGDARERAFAVAKRGPSVRIGAGRLSKEFRFGVLSPEQTARLPGATFRATRARELFSSRYAGQAHNGAAMVIGVRDSVIRHALANFSKEYRKVVRETGILHDLEAQEAATFHAEGTTLSEHEGVQRLAQHARDLQDANFERSRVKNIGVAYRKEYVPIRWKDEELRKGILISGKRRRLPGDQAHMRLRGHPHVADAVAKYPGAVETNLPRLVLQRQAEQIKAEADADMQRTLVSRFGIEAGKYDPENIPTGYRTAQSLGMQYVNPDSLLPDEVAATYEHLLTPRWSDDDPSALFSRLTLSRVSRAWARLKLMTPGFDVRNTRDEAILAAQAGINPITAAIRGVRVQRGKGYVGGRSPLTNEQARWLANTVGGVTQAGLATVETEGARGLARLGPRGERFQEMLHNARVYRENAQRLGTYATLLRRGMTPGEAMDATEQIHLPYHDPGLFVEGMRRSGLGSPFFTWIGRNLPRQLQLLAKRPGQLAAYSQLQKHLSRDAGGPFDILPEWAQREGAFGIPGLGFIGARTPQSDLSTMLPIPGEVGGARAALGNDVGSLAPFLQGGLDIASGLAGSPLDLGRYIATGSMPSGRQNVSGLEALALGQIPGVLGHGSVVGSGGTDIPTTTVPRWLGQAYQLLDPTALGHVSNIVSSAEGLTPQSPMDQAISLLTNETVYPANAPSDWKWTEIQKQQAVNAAIKNATSVAFAARLQPPPIAQAMKDQARARIEQAAADYKAFKARMQAAGFNPGG